MSETPIAAAKRAGLVYVTDQEPGIARRRAGKAFSYFKNAKKVSDAATLDRIKHLVIPPAWEDVWICANPRGHLQATGRDAKGRKQHRYHPDFRAHQESAKFDHIADFAEALPALRAAIEKDRRKPGLPRERVLATIVHLLDTSLIRVGNDEYAAQNKSYGLTTLLNKHVAVAGDELKFVFTGKSGKTWRLRMKDRRVANVIRALQDLPGQRLFQYVDDDGAAREVHSTDINAYLRDVSGREISAKDFRTWAGTVLAAVALTESEPAESAAGAKRNVREVVKHVAARLGNTPAICRKCYVHPCVIERYESGELKLRVSRRCAPGLSPEERAVLSSLKAPKRAAA